MATITKSVTEQQRALVLAWVVGGDLSLGDAALGRTATDWRRYRN